MTILIIKKDTFLFLGLCFVLDFYAGNFCYPSRKTYQQVKDVYNISLISLKKIK